jgi:hypothetical protein
MTRVKSATVTLTMAAVLAAGVLAGCGGPDLDAAERANAACISALRPKLPDTEQSDLNSLQTQVTRDGKAWIVEGQLPSTGRQIRCHVVADPADSLRGMRTETTWLGPDPTQ